MATPDISPGSVSLEWIGATLRTIQAEQRSVRDENKLIRSALSEAITLMMARIAGSEDVLLARIAHFEALVETRLDKLERMIDGGRA
jgi:hypothetical protein